MNIYLLDADVINYQVLVFKNNEDARFSLEMNGQSVKNDWKPFELEYSTETEAEKKLPKGDFPSLLSGDLLVFSPKAVDCLKDLLNPYGEFLPVNCDNDDYILFNVTNVIDALDFEKSDVQCFTHSNDIKNILKYVFIKEKVINEDIFRIKQMPQVDIFVNDKFVEIVE